ncbi:MAG: hypothetical protein L0H70_04885 [Xanthomonadales bacterium]|nr:hypothetical protein [Xanthomonadales bacterium]
MSPGLDYAPANEGRDLEGHTRSVDLFEVFSPNVYGPRDLGAYEKQAYCAVDDTVFCNGFDSPTT